MRAPTQNNSNRIMLAMTGDSDTQFSTYITIYVKIVNFNCYFWKCGLFFYNILVYY